MVMTDHVRLLIAVRWNCYRNSLKKSGMKRAKFVTGLLSWLLAAVGGLGSAAAFFVLGNAAAMKGKPAILGLGLFLVFGLWQLAPVIFEATAPMLNFRDLARYPIAFRTFYLLHLIYGLLDPSVILGLIWLSTLWVGMLFANTGWAARAIVPLFLFTAFNILANRFVISLLDRVLATRRGRERVFAGVMLLLVGSQITFYGILPRFGAAGVKQLALRLLPLWTWSPPGLAMRSVTAPAADSAIAIAALVIFSVVAGLLLGWQLRSVFAGEIYSESQRRSGAVQIKPGWSLPLVSDTTSAIVEKELRYCLRESRTLMNIAMPTMFALMIVISRGAAQKIMAAGFHTKGGSNFQVMFSAAAVFVLGYLAYNCFGVERSGVDRWRLSPTSNRQLLLAKNIAVCLLWATSGIVVNLVLLASGTYSLRLLGLTLIGVTYGAFGLLAAGNQLSVRLPLKVESGSMTSKVMTEGTILVSILLLLTLGGSAWVTVAAARWLSRPWITPLGLALLASIAAALYVASVNNAARYLDRNFDKISAELA